MRKFFLSKAVLGSIILLSPFAPGQDAPSLGDAGRLARQQKQQKEAQAKDSATPNSTTNAAQPIAPKKTIKIITNDEIPEHISSAARPPSSDSANHHANDTQPSPANSEAKAESLRSQIAEVKSAIGSLQHEIDSVGDSIRLAPANCAANCVQWNEHQMQKQQQVEQMKAQLEDQKKRLEEMQESARQQGFGSAVYDP
jgi:predicted RNase H-like nuclease (RuvC/YqgF family)